MRRHLILAKNLCQRMSVIIYNYGSYVYNKKVVLDIFGKLFVNNAFPACEKTAHVIFRNIPCYICMPNDHFGRDRLLPYK